MSISTPFPAILISDPLKNKGKLAFVMPLSPLRLGKLIFFRTGVEISL